jgi:hypothetical protein
MQVRRLFGSRTGWPKDIRAKQWTGVKSHFVV